MTIGKTYWSLVSIVWSPGIHYVIYIDHVLCPLPSPATKAIFLSFIHVLLLLPLLFEIHASQPAEKNERKRFGCYAVAIPSSSSIYLCHVIGQHKSMFDHTLHLTTESFPPTTYYQQQPDQKLRKRGEEVSVTVWVVSNREKYKNDHYGIKTLVDGGEGKRMFPTKYIYWSFALVRVIQYRPQFTDFLAT